MKTIRHSINWTIISATIFLLFTGCGYDPKDPVYDTVANSDNYPLAALSLLDDIEAGELVSIDSISSRFADLYSSESDLLDNSKWKQVIERLGARLSYKADSLVMLGLSEYNVAAGYYSLASFARPHDEKMSRRAKQFGVWLVFSAENTDKTLSIVEKRATVAGKIDLLRSFWSGDDLSRDFAAKYLVAKLFTGSEGKAVMSDEEAESLSSIDLALARALALTTKDIVPVLASFALGTSDAREVLNEPDAPDAPDVAGIDLVAARVQSVAKSQYMVEAYFTVKERVSVEYTISVRAGTARGSKRLLDENLSFVPFEARPIVPILQWREGETYAVFLHFNAPVEPTGVAIGLFETNSKPVRFVSTTRAGKKSDFVRIPGL